MTAPDPRLDEIQATFQRALSTFAWPETPEERDAAESELTADVRYLLAELRKAREALERVEGLHKPVTVYELDDVNGTWIYDGDEKRVLTTLCAECTPDFVLSEIEEGDYDGGGSDADIYWPCPTKAAVAAAKGDEQ